MYLWKTFKQLVYEKILANDFWFHKYVFHKGKYLIQVNVATWQKIQATAVILFFNKLMNTKFSQTSAPDTNLI